MQVIAGTFASNRDPSLPDNVYDPLANIVASMRYAIRQYGGLHRAYDDPTRGYADGGPVKPLLFDAGGYLPTGISMVQNNTGRPEPLRRMDQGGTGPTTLVFVDADGALIGRMRGEAAGVITANAAHSSRAMFQGA